MIVYHSSKSSFVEDVKGNCIEDKILQLFQRHVGTNVSKNELRSWKNSMQYMQNVLDVNTIPDDSNVSIEYVLPQTSKRIDFIITGEDRNNQQSVVVVELKQWEDVQKTEMDGVVRTYVGRAKGQTLYNTAIIQILMENPSEEWGRPCFPPCEGVSG